MQEERPAEEGESSFKVTLEGQAGPDSRGPRRMGDFILGMWETTEAF